MNANEPDAVRDHRREEALARRLGEAFDRQQISPAGECLDPELIAAYHQRSLSLGDDAICEAHFATCPRCRKILTVLAASADWPLEESEKARLGEIASV